ncbi:hypothetical protein HHK36_005665 [Tetracentron sinense]|uniref:Uncharacterized protein n=1 Tax=Tetracentron sinense TaxID=13715 RepID=A0A834ZNQ2_TETSI|nr:hypothetical protein HHK36_005665 [Tetracentron sinense]
MEFRARDYSAEEAAYSLPRVRADNHPLATRSSSRQLFDHDHYREGKTLLVFFDSVRYLDMLEETAIAASSFSSRGLTYSVDAKDHKNNDFFDPLRGPNANVAVFEDVQDGQSTSTRGRLSNETALQLSMKEWASFKRFLMQKFSVSKTVSISSMSDVIVKSGKAYDKSSTSMHLEELDDPQKFAEEDVKVAKLLMDTSVLQFYPALFVLVTDVIDMLGDMVWERIKRKAEYAENGTKFCSLPDNFKASDICSDAKETCYNWFCKIGSIRELLPRIYLELAILPCWRFLHNQPQDCLQRLVMMMRGLADPLASAYCRLYMAHCAQKLQPCDRGYLIACVNDIKILLMPIVSGNVTTKGNSLENGKLLMSLSEPMIEWIMKCIFKDSSQVEDILVELGLGRNQSKFSGTFPSISIVLHHLLKELPAEVVNSNALEIMHLIECSNDFSFDQCLNYRLIGFKMCERRPQMDIVNAVVAKVFQVVTQYDGLDEYLKVMDAYLDIVLQCQLDNYLTMILDGISKRACNRRIAENELGSLQSIFIKLLTYFNDLEDAFALNHFVKILDVMYGSSRNVVNTHILNKATRNGYIRDPTTIQLLFEISQALHDGIDFSNMKEDDKQQPARLISRFVQMVDYGADMEHHLTFLVECRGAFGSINELKETLVHTSNYLAIKAMKDANKILNFVKCCIAFSEVTIPSISARIGQINLYLETAEVALLGGLVSHSDGLIDSAISCLQNFDLTDGSQVPFDMDGILSSIRKICSLLVMVPGNPERGVTYILRSILSFVSSESWITPRLRIRTLCAIVSLSATLSQNKLPYHANNIEVLGNDLLFVGDPSYHQELASVSGSVLQNLIDVIQQEPSRAARGSIALEACNCIVSSFKVGYMLLPTQLELIKQILQLLNLSNWEIFKEAISSVWKAHGTHAWSLESTMLIILTICESNPLVNHEIAQICSKLVEIAKSCLNANDKYLQSTVNFLDKQSTFWRATAVITSQ